MNLPAFLVIGAMKCGTTTLYRDLATHPEIFLAEKESNFLSRQGSQGTEAAEEYAKLFRNSQHEQCLGDVSTEYSMLPDIQGVASRAGSLLGSNTKIIYLVREPVSRCISHHYHMHSWHGEGKMGADINVAVEEHPSIINYSRYAMQLQPWREVFGDESIQVVLFEEYIQNRTETINRLCRFLGVSPLQRPIDTSKVHNKSDSKPVLNLFWQQVRESTLYQRVVRPRLRTPWKDALRKCLLPQAPARPAPPHLSTVEKILEATAEDTDRLADFMQRDQPLWSKPQAGAVSQKQCA